MYEKKYNISFLVDKCSLHPYWMAYALSFIPLVLTKWANSKIKHLSIHVYILIFCFVWTEHTPKIALSISKTPPHNTVNSAKYMILSIN
jgi:hypothetical protein